MITLNPEVKACFSLLKNLWHLSISPINALDIISQTREGKMECGPRIKGVVLLIL